MKNIFEDFFFSENACACVLGPWSCPRAFLSLASRGSVLGKAVLGISLGFFFVSLALASSLGSSTPPLVKKITFLLLQRYDAVKKVFTQAGRVLETTISQTRSLKLTRYSQNLKTNKIETIKKLRIASLNSKFSGT